MEVKLRHISGTSAERRKHVSTESLTVAGNLYTLVSRVNGSGVNTDIAQIDF